MVTKGDGGESERKGNIAGKNRKLGAEEEHYAK
jgi:hypothetical protein